MYWNVWSKKGVVKKMIEIRTQRDKIKLAKFYLSIRKEIEKLENMEKLMHQYGYPPLEQIEKEFGVVRN